MLRLGGRFSRGWRMEGRGGEWREEVAGEGKREKSSGIEDEGDFGS